MQNPISKKTLVFLVCGLVFAFVLAIVMAFAFSGKQDTDVENATIQNQDNVFGADEVTKEDLEKIESEKEEISEVTLSNVERKILQSLSVGDYSGLEDELSPLENTYRDSTDPAIVLQMERIHGVRQDLALISGIDTDNGENLLKSFSCPDTLASALLYLPLQTKYTSFMNLSAIAIPSISDESANLVRLQEKPFTEEESASLLADLNERWQKDFVKIARYSATVAEREVEIIVVQDSESAFWRPYTIRPADGNMDGFVSIQTIKKQADALLIQNALDQLDDLISYDETEPQYYAGDPGAPDRESNVDESIESIESETTEPTDSESQTTN